MLNGSIKYLEVLRDEYYYQLNIKMREYQSTQRIIEVMEEKIEGLNRSIDILNNKGEKECERPRNNE